MPIEIGTELGDPGYTRIRYEIKIIVKNQLTDRPTPAWGYGVSFFYDLSAVPFSAGPGATLGRGRDCRTPYATTQIDGRKYCGVGMSLSMGSGGPDEPIAAGAEVDGGVPSNIFVAWVVDDANLDAARTYLQRPSYWQFNLAPAGSGGAYGLESFRFPYTSS
ncbi:hypothetical protein [Micromonospora sp. NPDC005299]|uniref:hypothetical protein n=1 Tax=Micromonospora sp. NPDC005299 TaxID=3364231 RepID=UPI0036990F85